MCANKHILLFKIYAISFYCVNLNQLFLARYLCPTAYCSTIYWKDLFFDVHDNDTLHWMKHDNWRMFTKLLRVYQKHVCLSSATQKQYEWFKDMWPSKGGNKEVLLSNSAKASNTEIVQSILLPGRHKSKEVQLGAIKQISVWKDWL